MIALAIDIGTTFVEVAVVDPVVGRASTCVSVPNKQIFFGTNVVTRLSAALEGHELDLQEAAQESVIDALAIIVRDESALSDVGDLLARTERIVAAANSVMAPLFCGVAPEGLAQAPFTPVEIERCETGPLVRIWRKARGDETLDIEMMRPVSAFVGGDARAALIATGLNDFDERSRLVVDLGTNAEIMLRKGEDLYVASVPAGPTFEGRLGATTTRLRGSEVIDLLAERLKSESIDSSGLVIDSDAALPFNQQDIRDFQLAKAAVRVGVDMVLQYAGVQPLDIEEVSLVGAFGSNLNDQSVRALGLLPPGLPETTFRSRSPKSLCLQSSNAALVGAVLVALNQSSDITGTVHHIELARDKDFADALMHVLAFD